MSTEEKLEEAYMLLERILADDVTIKECTNHYNSYLDLSQVWDIITKRKEMVNDFTFNNKPKWKQK